MKTKHTKGELSIIKVNYDQHPKEVITGIGISKNLKGGIYSNVLFTTILPNSDEEYIAQHEQIKADSERIVKCWNMHNELMNALKLLIDNGYQMPSNKDMNKVIEVYKKAKS